MATVTYMVFGKFGLVFLIFLACLSFRCAFLRLVQDPRLHARCAARGPANTKANANANANANASANANETKWRGLLNFLNHPEFLKSW